MVLHGGDAAASIRKYSGLTIHVLATDRELIEGLRAILDRLGLLMVVHGELDDALEFLQTEREAIVLFEDGFGVHQGRRVDQVLAQAPTDDFIVLTRKPDVTDCIVYMSLGVAGYLSFPVDPNELAGQILRCLERTSNSGRLVLDSGADLSPAVRDFHYPGIIGNSSGMVAVIDRMRRAAPTEIPILLLGENGTGKEVMARAIHENSRCRQGPFIPVHIGAIPTTLIESELFGHKKGTFTGAYSDRIGKIKASEGGTLFLDEIGDISAEAQVKLLRVLENHEFTRIGDNRPQKAEFRLICATNRDLEAMMREGEFREDLYFRLKGMVLTLPPLRERAEDIPRFVDLFVANFNLQYGNQRQIQEVPPETYEAFKRGEWRGNIRELRNQVEVCAVLTDDGVLRYGEGLPASSAADGDPIAELLASGKTLQDIQREVVRRALSENGGNRKRTAEQLGIPERTFYRMLDRFGLKDLKYEDAEPKDRGEA